MVSQTPAGRPGPGCRTYWAWVLANTLGWTIGLAVGEGVAGAYVTEPDPTGTPPCGDWSGLIAFIVGLLLGLLVSGAVSGIGQWLVLRPHIRRAGWWIPATFGGWLVGEVVSIIIIYASKLSWGGFIVAGAVFATTIGVGQVLVLERTISSGTGWWIPANIGGWFAGWILGGVTVSIFDPLLATIGRLAIMMPVVGGVFGIMAGAGYGMITGAVLNWLLQYAPHPSPPDPLSPLPMGEGLGVRGEGGGGPGGSGGGRGARPPGPPGGPEG